MPQLSLQLKPPSSQDKSAEYSAKNGGDCDCAVRAVRWYLIEYVYDMAQQSLTNVGNNSCSRMNMSEVPTYHNPVLLSDSLEHILLTVFRNL
jgi:hypothetical protein